MAQELEDALGGQYSILSQDFQLPLVRLLLSHMMQSKLIPDLPKQDVHPVITAGMQALGRTHEQARLIQWLQEVGAVLGPQVLMETLNATEFMRRSGVNHGVDLKGLLYTPEEIQARNQQAQAQAMMQNVAPDVVKGVADYAKESAKGTGSPPPGGGATSSSGGG